nr:MAG TPA: tail tape measure protein [Caudoviricetes sp.]
MQSIIQKQREYSAELTSATAALGKNATAQERATSVASILRKQIQNQESAISAQNLMLQKAVNKYGEASVQASKFRTSMYNTNAELQTLKSRLSEAESGLESFSDKASDSGDSLQGSITAGMLAAKAYETVGKTLLDAGKQVVQVGISYNAQLEQYQTALTNMLGSSEEAQSILEEIKQDAARTPFDTAGLVKANELLISTGVDAESSRKTILALGDAVSATGGGNDELSRMAQNLQQIKNAGKATAADIKQFAYAGIDVYGILADYTGKSTAEVQKMTVTYDLLTAALEKASDEGGRYYNSMQTQSETLNGQMSTLQDNATQLAGLMTEDLTNGIKMVVSNVNDLTVAATEAYKTDGWVGLLDAITDCMGPIASLKTQFESFASSSISWLDQLSYKLNKALGKDAYAGYESYEDYRKQTDHQTNRDRRRQEALAGKGISSQKQYDRLHPKEKTTTGGTGGTTTGSSAQKSTAKVAADQKKLANSVTETSTELLEGTGNIVGAIKQVTETADNTYNVYDGTTKQLKGTTEETAQTITRSWTEMVDGVQKNYKQVVTLLNGVEQSSKTTIEGVQAASKTSVGTKTEKIYGVDGVVGALDRTTTTTKKIEQVLDETTGELKDTVTSTTDVVTDSYVAIIDGIAQTVERTTTYVDGVVTDVQEKTSGLKEEIVDVQGTIGGFGKFVLDLDTKLGGLEKVASNLSKSPLSNWFADLNKGYRASDSFFDNIDWLQLGGSVVSMGIQGYKLTGGNPWGAAAGAVVGGVSYLLGQSLSAEAGTWGADLVSTMAGGMESNAGKLVTAAKNIANKIAEYIHFSRPDVGPLREYEKWMPDMIDGMAKGIKDNAYVLRDAAKGLSGQIETQLTYDVGRSNAAMSAAYTNRRINMGGVSLNIYPPSGMDAEEIAQYTIDRLQAMVNAEAAANGEIPVF